MLTSLYLLGRNLLSGAMPQGSWLGPLSFLVLINDLSTGCPVHKYVDDTTLSEVLPPKQLTSNMETYLHNLTDWATLNGMQLNTLKTRRRSLVLWLKPTCLCSQQRQHKQQQQQQTLSIGSPHSNCLEFTLIQQCHGLFMLTTWTVKKATRRLYFLKR